VRHDDDAAAAAAAAGALPWLYTAAGAAVLAALTRRGRFAVPAESVASTARRFAGATAAAFGAAAAAFADPRAFPAAISQQTETIQKPNDLSHNGCGCSCVGSRVIFWHY